MTITLTEGLLVAIAAGVWTLVIRTEWLLRYLGSIEDQLESVKSALDEEPTID